MAANVNNSIQETKEIQIQKNPKNLQTLYQYFEGDGINSGLRAEERDCALLRALHPVRGVFFPELHDFVEFVVDLQRVRFPPLLLLDVLLYAHQPHTLRLHSPVSDFSFQLLFHDGLLLLDLGQFVLRDKRKRRSLSSLLLLCYHCSGLQEKVRRALCSPRVKGFPLFKTKLKSENRESESS